MNFQKSRELLVGSWEGEVTGMKPYLFLRRLKLYTRNPTEEFHSNPHPVSIIRNQQFIIQ
jgi:hypothetical protein